MDSKNILGNEVAMAILNDTATRLRAIGVHCMVSPLSLPQGMSVSLHAGATEEAATAADVAAGRGGEYAHAVDTHKQFARMVELAIADAADRAVPQFDAPQSEVENRAQFDALLKLSGGVISDTKFDPEAAPEVIESPYPHSELFRELVRLSRSDNEIEREAYNQIATGFSSEFKEQIEVSAKSASITPVE